MKRLVDKEITSEVLETLVGATITGIHLAADADGGAIDTFTILTDKGTFRIDTDFDVMGGEVSQATELIITT